MLKGKKQPQLPVRRTKKNQSPVRTDSQGIFKKLAQAEKELANQRELNKKLSDILELQMTILEKSLTGYYIVLNGKFHIMNSMASSFSGYRPGELIGKRADFLVHPEDRAAVKKKARLMLKEKGEPPYEFRILTKKGEPRWLLEAIVPISFEGKQAILGTSMDITRQKLFEQKMIESENLYRTIFETTGSMTMIGDEHKNISLLNAEFEKFTGYRREDWEGRRSWTEYIHKDDLPFMEESHRMRRINPEAVPKTYESRLIDSQGKIRHILLSTSMIPGTKNHVSTAMDITNLKEAETQLIRKSENLSELNTALKVLLNQRENDRKDFEATLLSNVKELVLPGIEKIRRMDPEKKFLAYLDLLESNLKHIVAPFSRTLSANYTNLTSTEIEVANFVKEGKNSKEISELLNITSSCVDIHRYHIRKKLGLARRDNLRAFLKSLPS